MTKKQEKIARIFMLVIGITLISSGIIVLLSGKQNFKETLINNFHFFITGGILTFLGLTWRKNKN